VILLSAHSEHFMSLGKPAIAKAIDKKQCTINQGDCVNLINDQNLFQVIAIDSNHKKCWVRRWPLVTNGAPVFEISTNQIVLPAS